MTTTKIVWIGVTLVALLVVWYIWNTYNYCRRTEVNNIAYQKASMLNLSEAITLVTGADAVLAKEDTMVRKQMQIAIARYSNAGQAMAWIQEQNLRVAPESYAKLQQILETYYAKFYNGQMSLLDQDRAYKALLSQGLRGTVGSWLGFPTQAYKDARIDELVLEKGVKEVYQSEKREMPAIPLK